MQAGRSLAGPRLPGCGSAAAAGAAAPGSTADVAGKLAALLFPVSAAVVA